SAATVAPDQPRGRARPTNLDRLAARDPRLEPRHQAASVRGAGELPIFDRGRALQLGVGGAAEVLRLERAAAETSVEALEPGLEPARPLRPRPQHRKRDEAV